MYAVVRTGGKQVRVMPGERVRVEKLPGDVGDTIELSEVLLVGGEGETRIGRPLVDGARVTGTIIAQGRGAKLMLFKSKRRGGYRRTIGHRQSYTEVQIDKID
jgi:large subunit ribosomal protein L21